MGFWSTLLTIDFVIGVVFFLLTGLGKTIWEAIKKKAPKLFYFPLKEEHFNGIPPYPTRAFALIFLNAAIIINLMVIVIYLGKKWA